MSYINVGIEPSQLTDEMLLDEHRRIKNVCALFKKAMASHIEPVIPDNDNDIMFFLDKGFYTEKRYIALHTECIKRGFNVLDYSDRWNIYLGTDYYGDYIPKHKKNISKQLNNMWDNYNYQGQYPFHYYGERITLVEALNL